MELRLYIRQMPQFNKQGQQIHYSGLNPASVSAQSGGLPVGSPRRWDNYGNFLDVTGDCSDLHKLKLTFTLNRTDDGVETIGVPNTKKAASGTISIEKTAFKYIKAWLLDDISAPLNSVEVRIEHVGCGFYDRFEIKSTDIQWCQSDVCQFDVTLKQKDEPLTCIKRTLIADNHKGWFPRDSEVPVDLSSGQPKYHPRFSYCNEQRPNGMMIMLWYIVNTFAGIFFTTLFPVILGYNALAFLINFTIFPILRAIASFINALGGNINTSGLKDLDYVNFNDVFQPFGQLFVESAGCGREHPAPLIRDYIKNVCDYCGVKVDETTAPIFFARNITIQTSNKDRGNNGVITGWNPHYNACYLSPTVKRGIRRFKTLGVSIPPFTNNQMNNVSFWIPENEPLKTLDMFLDEIKGTYNADWEVKSEYENGKIIPKLYFQRKDWFRDKPGSYVFDFENADRHKIIEGICYEWTGKKTPAWIEMGYANDAADTCGNEALSLARAYLSIGNVDDNPTFSGKLDKVNQYLGCAKFRLDGASTDYIYDAFQVVANGATLTPIPSYSFQLDTIAGYFEKYADYALLLKDETTTLPKIIIWDEQSGYTNAKAYRFYKYQPGLDPEINPKFNTSGQHWVVNHQCNNFVLGSSSNLGSFPPYKYTARTALGIAIITQADAMLVNYPMYFDPQYYDTLWDWFHWIDDPRLNPVLNQTGTVKIPLCCEDLSRLKPFYDASQIKLGEKIRVPIAYRQDGKITEIEISYDPDNILGSYIQIKFDV